MYFVNVDLWKKRLYLFEDFFKESFDSKMTIRDYDSTMLMKIEGRRILRPSWKNDTATDKILA